MKNGTVGAFPTVYVSNKRLVKIYYEQEAHNIVIQVEIKILG
jgi:hypothetical protein